MPSHSLTSSYRERDLNTLRTTTHFGERKGISGTKQKTHFEQPFILVSTSLFFIFTSISECSVLGFSCLNNLYHPPSCLSAPHTHTLLFFFFIFISPLSIISHFVHIHSSLFFLSSFFLFHLSSLLSSLSSHTSLTIPSLTQYLSYHINIISPYRCYSHPKSPSLFLRDGKKKV